MASGTEYPVLVGPAGPLAVAVDRPAGTSRGVALVTHPHPLYGGTMDNKVVQTLARAHVLAGWTAVRFNFRGSAKAPAATTKGLAKSMTCWPFSDMWWVTNRGAWRGFRLAPLWRHVR